MGAIVGYMDVSLVFYDVSLSQTYGMFCENFIDTPKKVYSPFAECRIQYLSITPTLLFYNFLHLPDLEK